MERVRQFASARVWVVGDLMLDEYLEGGVGRISPEAPVPVVKVARRFCALGGAANVARSVAEFGAAVRLSGVLGDDALAEEFGRLSEEAGIDPGGVVRDGDRPTTRKLRVLGQGQQLIRLDWEETGAVAGARIEALLDALLAGERPDVILVSDYAKGVVTRELMARLGAAARELGVPLLVDPKLPDPAFYAGATVLKPNLRELEAMVGRSLSGASDEALGEAAREVLEAADIETLVLTLGPRGLRVYTRDGQTASVEATQRDVFDVTGAGDTVLAVLALALASGAGLTEAATLANAAAGIVVGEVGTAAVSPEQLIDALWPREEHKQLSRTTISDRVRGWQRAGKKVVFTNGCFDLLHAGHLHMLRQCAALGDALVVGINTDTSVKRLKGEHRPLVPETERAALVGALDCVDAVVLFGEDTPLELLEAVRPDVLAKGADYRIDQVVGRELVEGIGGKVELVPLLPGHSTTELVDRIRAERRDESGD